MMARSSNWLGHCPFTAKITDSSSVRATRKTHNNRPYGVHYYVDRICLIKLIVH